MATKRASDAVVLREAGLRATPRRLRLIALLRASGKPMPVVGIVKASRGAFDTATAYRMLAALAEAGLVRPLALGGSHSLYELAEGHHHHAVCAECGAITDIEFCIPDSLDEKVRRAAGFANISRHSLEFYGTCRSCARP